MCGCRHEDSIPSLCPLILACWNPQLSQFFCILSVLCCVSCLFVVSPQVTETLHTSAELVAAGIAADNLVVSLYFAVLFAVAGQPCLFD